MLLFWFLNSQGRYCEALDEWEQAKEDGVAEPSLYSSVMQMAARVGGAEAARHAKEDMERQGWNMDHRYGNGHVNHDAISGSCLLAAPYTIWTV